MLNYGVKWCKNFTFCSALAQFRGKTSCIPLRHSSILKSSRQRWGRSAMSWRQNNGKMAEKDRSHVIAVLQSLKEYCWVFDILGKCPLPFVFTSKPITSSAKNASLRYVIPDLQDNISYTDFHTMQLLIIVNVYIPYVVFLLCATKNGIVVIIL